MASSKDSLTSLINRLLPLSQREDNMQGYLEVLSEAVIADACTTLLIDPAVGSARILGGIGLLTPEEEWPDPLETPFFAKQVTGSLEVAALESEGPFESDSFLAREGIASLLLKPAIVGETYLVTAVFRRDPGTFLPDDVEKFSAVSGVINTLLLLHHILKDQNILKGTDELTGLGLFSDFHQSMVKELSRARRSGGTVTMGIMSIDSPDPDFMNDTILDIARAFQDQLRNFDTLDRYGSSELAFILPELKSAEGVNVIERVTRETVSSLGGHVQVPDIYIGLSCYPEDGATVERLIEMAEAAMSQAVEDSTPGVFRWTENGER